MKIVLLQPPLAIGEDRANLDTMARAIERHADDLDRNDAVLLPEHFDFRSSRKHYEDDVRKLATELGCHVVGGSHHSRPESGDGPKRNSGIVADAEGRCVGRYEKLRPYARERNEVTPGQEVGELEIAGRRILVLICADFWFADLFQRARHLPDVVLVPAFSVSRKPTPDYSRELWRHLAIARAYEFGTFVGVSDWAHRPDVSNGLPASGVAGLADPTGVDPASFFEPVGAAHARVYDLDFDALHRFRLDRVERGFFWKTPE